MVLSRDEVRIVLGQMEGTTQLVTRLLYGAGLRLQEALRLRIKDVDFDRHEIVVRRGKGARDRRTIFPRVLARPLRDHIARVRELHDRDIAEEFGAVWMPEALAVKVPPPPDRGHGSGPSQRRVAAKTRASRAPSAATSERT